MDNRNQLSKEYFEDSKQYSMDADYDIDYRCDPLTTRQNIEIHKRQSKQQFDQRIGQNVSAAEERAQKKAEKEASAEKEAKKRGSEAEE